MDEKVKLLSQALGGHRIKTAENLAYHTQPPLKVTARYFYVATSQREFTQSLNTAFDLRIPFIVLGSGTKIQAKIIESSIFVIKNRTSGLKVGAVKGKVGRGGIGVDEAMIEADSGITLNRLNQFLEEQHLHKLNNLMFLKGTIGGSLFTEENLRDKIELVNVWEEGDSFPVSLDLLKSGHIVLSVVLRVKA